MAVAVPPESAGSVPPHNEEAEASVLGAILLTEQALDGVVLEIGLRSEHFYRPRHQRIFEAMIRLKEKAEPEAVDALTVCDDLRSQGALEEAGGEAYVHSLPTVIVADMACFPTSPEKNPTLTAMALAARAARRLVSDLGAG